MAIRPGDEDKMRNALGLPDALSKATGSDLSPEKAAELRRKAEADEAAEKASADKWDRDDGFTPGAGS